jgi:hypothetical protein
MKYVRAVDAVDEPDAKGGTKVPLMRETTG